VNSLFLNILIDYEVMKDAFIVDSDSSDSLVSRDVIDNIGQMFEEHGNFQAFITSQTKDKLESSLPITVSTRLSSFFEEEKTTRGVASFDPRTSLPESAKSLSLKHTTIVVLRQKSSELNSTNKRIFYLTPAQFRTTFQNSKKLFSSLSGGNFEFTEIFYLLLSKPTLFDGVSNPEKTQTDNS
jgi:hypothetical protein